MVVSYITLAVGDLYRMQQFYSGLGLQISKQSKKEDNPFVMYQINQLVLALYPRELLAKQSGVNMTGASSKGSISLSLNVRSTRHVDELIKTAKELGANICRDGFEPEWGGYCAYFRDPETNLWEVVWHPNFIF